MTREEASFYLANMDRKNMEEGMSEALDMAIKALEQEPCDDAISRQVVLEAIEDDKSERYSCFASNNDAECFKQIIRELPSVTPQQKMGRWKFTVYDANRIGHYECSECHWNVLMNVSDYCPHCGAKMEV